MNYSADCTRITSKITIILWTLHKQLCETMSTLKLLHKSITLELLGTAAEVSGSLTVTVA